MAETQTYNIKKDNRVMQVIENKEINDMGLYLVMLKRKHRPEPLVPFAIINQNGEIIEKFQDLFYEGFNGHDYMKDLLIPITYNRYYTEKYHNVQQIDNPYGFEGCDEVKIEIPSETPVENIKEIHPKIARCSYIDSRGYVYNRNRERYLIYQLINAKFSELPKVIQKININTLTQDVKKEFLKLDLFHKIITARIQNENPKVSEIQALSDAYDNLMDNLKEDMKLVSLKTGRNGKEYFSQSSQYGEDL